METIRNIEEANRCVRELAALSLLPAIWSGGETQQIRDNLADALASSLRAEIVCVQCADGASSKEREPEWRIKGFPQKNAVVEAVTRAMASAVSKRTDEFVETTMDGRAVRLVISQVGVQHEFGVLAIGATRGDFPTASERILLNVAVNQAVIAFRSAKQLATLRRSESNLRDFFENATLGLHWVDANGTIIWANRTELEMLGYSAEEYIGHSITEFHAEGCVIEDILARLTRGETLREYEAQLKCKDGSLRTVLIDSSVLFEQGKFIHTRCFTRDITSRKLAEQTATEASEQRRLAFEAAEVGSWDYQLDTGKIVWDERCRAMWGVSEGTDISIRLVMERLHPDDRENAAKAIQSALAGDQNGRYETDFRVILPDGSVRWIASRGQVYFAEVGERRPTRFVGITRDFTKEKQARDAIEASERELRALADSIPQLAWIAHPDGSRYWFNRPWYDYTGSTPEEVLGWGWQSVHDPKILPTVMANWKEAIAAGKPFQADFPLRGRDGTYRWFLTQVNPVRDAAGRVIRWFGTNTNVDEVKRAQDALREAQAELRAHAEKLEQEVAERTARLRETVQELEAFSYSISHDMRAPLRAMQGYADALLEEFEGKLGHTGEEYLFRIRRSAKRMDMLIQDVLAYSRVAKGDIDLKPVNVEAVIRDVVQNYPSLQVERADIVIRSPIPLVLGHEAYMMQIISNLLTNSAKFVARGTRPRIVVSATKEDQTVRLVFEDNGVGIAPENHKRIFTIFGRVYSDKQYEGTGIGLPIAKKAAERMGGTIQLESELGRGSKFIVTLRSAE